MSLTIVSLKGLDDPLGVGHLGVVVRDAEPGGRARVGRRHGKIIPLGCSAGWSRGFVPFYLRRIQASLAHCPPLVVAPPRLALSANDANSPVDWSQLGWPVGTSLGSSACSVVMTPSP